jgi:hypothetical protein
MVVVHLQDTQIRDLGSERVAPDLRMGSSQSSEKTGFSGIRLSHEPNIRNETKLNPEGEFRARFTFLREPGSLMSSSGKVRIALAATTTVEQLNLHPVIQGIHKDFPRVKIRNNGAWRHLDDGILTVGTVSVPPPPLLAVNGLDNAGPRQVKQRPKIIPHGNNEIPAAPAIATVGSALRNVLLPAKRDLPSAAVAG